MRVRYSLLIFFITLLLFASFWALAGERQVPKEVENEDSLSIKWYKYDEGLAKAQPDDKHILLFFRSRWCKWCNIMEKITFTNQEVLHRLSNDFIPVKIDVDSEDKVMELIRPVPHKVEKISDGDVARMYNVFSYPYCIFLEPNQNNIGVLPGYVETKVFLLLLEYVGDNHNEKENLEEFSKRKKEKAKKK